MKQNTIERKIMWGDLDSLGIVFYPRYYEWIDACGHLFFESIDLNINKLWREQNLLFGLVETSCKYFHPGRYHQIIRITTQIDALEKKTLTLSHTISNDEDNTLMVKGFEKRICLDASNPKDLQAVNIPEDIYAVLKRAVGE